jgi:hypothetical protein
MTGVCHRLPTLLLVAVAAGAAEPGVPSWTLDPAGAPLRAVAGPPRQLPSPGGPTVLALGVAPGDAECLVGTVPAGAPSAPPFTLEAWIHPTQCGEWDRLALNWGAPGHRAYHFALHRGRGSLVVCQRDGTEVFCEGGRVEPGQWTHLVGVADPAARRLRLHVQGELVAEVPFDGTMAEGSGQLGIGDSATDFAPGLRFRGYLGALRAWDRALTTTEIAARRTVDQARFTTAPKETGLTRALALKAIAERHALDDAQAEEAAQLLGDPDPFVRAAAEWALALRVGHDNDGGAAVWPRADAPAWFTRYLAVTPAQRIECDMIRHALARGLSSDPVALQADLRVMAERAERVARTLGEPSRQQAAALRALVAATPTATSIETALLRGRWLQARHLARAVALAQPELAFDELLVTTRFALHHKPNVCGIHYSWAYKPGGDLCVLRGFRGDQPTAAPLLQGRLGAGHVHGSDLAFAADRIVFGWARQPDWPPRGADGRPVDLVHQQNNYAYELTKLTEPIHLYELDLASGVVTQLTDHRFHNDLEPVYLPDGGIAFASDRSAHSPACDGWENDIADTTLYRLAADRQNLRRLTYQKDVDLHPHLLNDGRIGYLRWEYTERGFWPVHSFWAVNPDGTMADALYKQYLTSYTSVRDVRSIERSARYVGIAAGHHAQAVGSLVRLHLDGGVNDPRGTELVARGSGPQENGLAAERVAGGGVPETPGYYHAPYGLSDDAFLVSFGFGAPTRFRYRKTDLISNDAGLYFVDTHGNKELLYRDPLLCVVGALPLRARATPPARAPRHDPTQAYATCMTPDVYEGTEIPRGTIKALRIMESLPWPVDAEAGARYYGGSSFNWQGNQELAWGPVRVIGTVPVEADGSAHFKVPVMDNASVYFQALDEHGMEVQRMRTSIAFAPGEVRGCTGCHESRGHTAPPSVATLAARRPPTTPVPPPWGHEPLDYETLIQPILDRRCISCHDATEPDGGLALTGEKVRFGIDAMCASFFNIRKRNLVVCSNQNMQDGSVTRPRQFGSHPSRFTRILLDDRVHRELDLTDEERRTLFTWVDANTPYHAKLVNKRSGLPTPDRSAIVPTALTSTTGRPVREAFNWPPVWGAPVEVSAR